jgi:hypothetical protein
MSFLPCFTTLAILPPSEILSGLASHSFGTNWAKSSSGQFLITAERPFVSPAVPASLRTNRNVVRLNPTLLAVSAERVRQALVRELNDGQPWHGKIYIVLHPAGAGQAITITPQIFSGAWNYRLDLPDHIQRESYTGAMVHVLLLEMANRNAQERSAEVPLWLSQGLSRQLLAASPIDLLLSQSGTSINGLSVGLVFSNDTRLKSPLLQAEQQMGERPALSFQELSWPTQDFISSEKGELYRDSAQLFVAELLNLKDGPACFRAMLAGLPLYYNWQFAFLAAFHSHFERLLDVEKWWTLHRVGFAGRDVTLTWSAEESWRKLDEVLHCAVEIRTPNEGAALRDQVAFQTVIQQWDRTRQDQTLRTKVRDLELLRLRVLPEFLGLVEDYRKTLSGYLQIRDQASVLALLKKGTTLSRPAADAIEQLNALDERRQKLRPAQRPATSAQGQATQ